MGSSSGGWDPPSRGRVDDLIDRTRDETLRQAYDVAVNRLLDDILQDLNDRDVAAVRQHLNALKEILEADQEGTIELFFGGSVLKHTYADGLSDVDMLAIINRSDLASKSPQEVIEAFGGGLRQRFPSTDITTGELAVTIRYSDGVEIQILPALRTSDGLHISRADGGGWSNVTRPDAFARKLTSVNQSQNGVVIPVIKLFKSLLESSESGVKLSGYHVESMAIEAFEHYTGPRTRKEMLQYFLTGAAELVKTPIQDRSGQSIHVDDYLGVPSSRERLDAAARLQRLAKRLESADRDNDVGGWTEMFPGD